MGITLIFSFRKAVLFSSKCKKQKCDLNDKHDKTRPFPAFHPMMQCPNLFLWCWKLFNLRFLLFFIDLFWFLVIPHFNVKFGFTWQISGNGAKAVFYEVKYLDLLLPYLFIKWVFKSMTYVANQIFTILTRRIFFTIFCF